MPAADLISRGRRIGFILVAVAIGMVVGGFLSGGLSSSSGAGATETVGPDVGEIRVGAAPAGPSAKVDGVGVGFARSEEGAVAAATNLVLTIEQAATAQRSEAIKAYEILAAEGSRDFLAGEMAATWDLLHGTIAANGPLNPTLFLRTVPVGHQLVRYSDDRATVGVWTLSIVAADGMADPLANWETATVELVWEDEDWKVWSSASAEGPNPAWAEGDPTAVEAFLSIVDDLEGYRYVSG